MAGAVVAEAAADSVVAQDIAAETSEAAVVAVSAEPAAGAAVSVEPAAVGACPVAPVTLEVAAAGAAISVEQAVAAALDAAQVAVSPAAAQAGSAAALADLAEASVVERVLAARARPQGNSDKVDRAGPKDSERIVSRLRTLARSTASWVSPPTKGCTTLVAPVVGPEMLALEVVPDLGLAVPE